MENTLKSKFKYFVINEISIWAIIIPAIIAIGGFILGEYAVAQKLFGAENAELAVVVANLILINIGISRC